MPREYDTASAVRASRGTGEDRVAVISLPEGVAIAVADGAGGIGEAGKRRNRRWLFSRSQSVSALRREPLTGFRC
jgi:hypothetical protein